MKILPVGAELFHADRRTERNFMKILPVGAELFHADRRTERNFMKNLPVGAALFHADRRTDGQTDMTKRIVPLATLRRCLKSEYFVDNYWIWNISAVLTLPMYVVRYPLGIAIFSLQAPNENDFKWKKLFYTKLGHILQLDKIGGRIIWHRLPDCRTACLRPPCECRKCGI